MTSRGEAVLFRGLELRRGLDESVAIMWGFSGNGDNGSSPAMEPGIGQGFQSLKEAFGPLGQAGAKASLSYGASLGRGIEAGMTGHQAPTTLPQRVGPTNPRVTGAEVPFM
jgi:hypothetical protein